MSFEMNKFRVVKKKRLEKSVFNVECNIETTVEIDKILSVCHTAQAENAEILNGVINYAGTIDLCILYSTVDGEIGAINSSCPFTSKFEDESIMVGDKVGIDVEVEDYSVESVTSSNIKINCEILQMGVLICEKEVENVTTGDENMCIREDEVLVNTLIGQAKEIFSVESEFAIKEPVKKVLVSDCQVSVKAVESGVNFVSVLGEVVTRLLYLTEKDRFETSHITENFKEEVELEGVTREATSEAVACVKKNAVKCEVEETDKGVNVSLTIPVEVKIVSFIEKSEIVIKDIYSIANELAVTTESFEMSKSLQGDVFETKIDGTLTLEEDKPRVDKVMFVGGSNLVITNSYLKNGEVFVEGVTKTNVVYLNDETNSLHSVIVEVPFVVSEKSNVTCENAEVDGVYGLLYDVDVVVKKGREFYFDAKLKINVNYECDDVGAVITKVEVTGDYQERDCSIELLFASEGQTSWDLAKSVKVKEDTIISQNSEISFPLEKDENIVVYYQKR